MNKTQTSQNNQWRSVDTLLRRWLAERRHLLSLYCAMSGALKNGSAGAAGVGPKLDRFCEILVDYVSAGHFEVYCELFAEGERSGSNRHVEVEALYRLIVTSTAVALDFNDRYLRGDMHDTLAHDLSQLGQMLASRFDWEDALTRHLHQPRQAVA